MFKLYLVFIPSINFYSIVCHLSDTGDNWLKKHGEVFDSCSLKFAIFIIIIKSTDLEKP